MAGADYVNRLLRLRESLVHIDNAIASLDKAHPEIVGSQTPECLVNAYDGLRTLQRQAEKMQEEAWKKLTGGG